MRIRLLYDSVQQVDPGATLARLPDQGIEQELVDIRFLNETSTICGALSAEAINLVDSSVPIEKSCVLLGYAFGRGHPVILIDNKAGGRPAIDRSAVNVAIAAPENLAIVLPQLLADLERQQIAPEGNFGLFTQIEPGEAVALGCTPRRLMQCGSSRAE